MKTQIFRASLTNWPKILREIEVPENFSLYNLAEAIVDSYNFNFDHCFGFYSKISPYRYFDSEKSYDLFADLFEEGEDIEPTGAESVKKTKVGEVWKDVGDKMLFLFDYGDNWQFIVELIGSGSKEPRQNYPRILKKTGRAPRQY